MKNNNFKKGSQWRKWDLHIHTPKSIHQKYGGDSEWDNFINSLEKLPEDIKVIGITDYYFIDGYEKIMAYKNNGRLKNIDKIFPLLEFRIDTFGSGNENKLQKINLHILFDVDESNLKVEIEKIRKEFIEQIKISTLEKYNTKCLSIKNLTEAGEGKLKKGFDNFIPPTKDVFKLINSNTWKEKTILLAGYKEWGNLDKNQQLKPKKEDLYEKVSLFLSPNIDTFDKSRSWLDQFGNKKLIHSLDIHDFDTLTKNYKCYTWIKADTTFKGLLQAINEPKDRIYIGNKPEVLERVKDNSTKYIKSLEIDAISNYKDEQGVWFKGQNIPINNELVTIIGNKGNGKSAIADILAFCGDSDIEENDYRFLHKDKFKKNNLAKNYLAKVLWEDNSPQKFINLNASINTGVLPKVKYITQGYFEKLCNEISKIDYFEEEIEKVVFQHVNEAEKLDTYNFKDLIKKKKNQVDSEKKLLIEALTDINTTIIKLEDKLSENYKKEIESKLETKKKELEAHEKNKPKKIEEPKQELSDEQKEKKKELDKLKNEHSKLSEKITETKKIEKQLNNDIFELEDLISSIRTKEKEMLTFKGKYKEKLEKFGININDVVKFSINLETIEKIKSAKQTDLGKAKDLLNVQNGQCLTEQEKKLSNKIKSIIFKLSEPEKLYQNYIKEYDKWSNKKNEIEGNENIDGTLKYLEKEMDYINNHLTHDINALRNERTEIGIKIFNTIKTRQEIYNSIKLSIDEVMKKNTTELKNYPIKIESTLKIKNSFIENFLKYINLNVVGSFKGKEDGEKKIKEIISETNFNIKENEEEEIKVFF